MRNLWKSLLGLSVIGMGIAMSAPALAATNAVGPYYATPSWDQTLPVATRFIVLTNMNSEAVLDRETGLVWEQSPNNAQTWDFAQLNCNVKTLGGRKGWRLPTLQELASLIDPTVAAPGPLLPPGHPFGNVQSSVFWSASSSASNSAYAWDVYFGDGGVGNSLKSNTYFIWCVRGGQGTDAQ
jgi:hypothetical protein